MVMKRTPTLYLRATLIVMAIVVLILCGFVLPVLPGNWAAEYPDLAYLKYPATFGLSLTAVAFFYALYQAGKLLRYIDQNKAFSRSAVRALKRITYAALMIGGLYVCALPAVFMTADAEDAPGLIVIFGLIFILIPTAIGAFSAVMQSLIQNALDLKSENDLTV